MSPGVTHFPLASMRLAPEGIATLLPTATIRPSRISTLASATFGPETGYTVPPVMAMVWARSSAIIGHSRAPAFGPVEVGARLVRGIGAVVGEPAVVVDLRG